MKLGLYMPTHGLGAMVDGQWTLEALPAAEMAVTETARRAEAAGYDSLWFSDHVLMAPSPESRHLAADPLDGTRAYPPSPDMLDAVACMGACAAVTDRIRLAPSVWISPYRHPLQDVRQFTSLDHLSDGRLVMGVGAGWMKEEFAALGLSFDERLSRTEEAIEVYTKAWTNDVVDHEGPHFPFSGVRMDPKPLQRPRPRVYYGGVSRRGARLAATHCDGFYPTFTDGQAEPQRYRTVLDELPDLLGAVGKDPASFSLLCVLSACVDDHSPYGLGQGPAAKVIDDLGALADQGFSMAVLHLDTRSQGLGEWRRQLDLVAEHVVGPAAAITAAGPWQEA